MQVRTFSGAALVAFAAACGDHANSLPFDTPQGEPVVRTIPAEGGTVSTPAGASVQLPAGAVAAGTTLTLTNTAAPATSPSGAAASPSAFRIEPAGLALAAPAAVGLTLTGGADLWLASVVVTTPSGTVESGQGSVDLAGGVLRGEISRLGTVSAVIPEPAAVLRAGPLSAATRQLAPASAPQTAVADPTRALRGDCGPAGRRCADLTVEVSPNLLETVAAAAVVYPHLSGEIRLNGTSATGSLTLSAPLRVRLQSGANATTVPARITAAATPATVVTETAGRITLTNLRVTGESAGGRGETTATLTVEYEGARAWIRLSHTLEASVGAGGAREAVTVAARIPLARVQ